MEMNDYSKIEYFDVFTNDGVNYMKYIEEGSNSEKVLALRAGEINTVVSEMKEISSADKTVGENGTVFYNVTYKDENNKCTMRLFNIKYKQRLESIYMQQQNMKQQKFVNIKLPVVIEKPIPDYNGKYDRKKTKGKKAICVISLGLVVLTLIHLPTILKKITPYDGKRTKVPAELLIETPRPHIFDINDDNQVNEVTAAFANELNKKFKYKPEIEKLKDIVLLANGVYPFDDYMVEDASNLLLSELNIVSAIAEYNAKTTIENEVSFASIVANPYYQDGVIETQNIVGKFKSEEGIVPVRRLFNYMEERFNEQSYREASAMTRLLHLYQIDSRYVESIKPSYNKKDLNEIRTREDLPAKFYVIYPENSGQYKVIYMPKIVKDEFGNELDTFFFDNCIENPKLSDGISEEELREMGAVQEGWETLYQNEKDKSRAEILELSQVKCEDYEEYKAKEQAKIKSKTK